MERVRRKDGEARREALLDAALRCFAREGVFTTGIEAIRKEAGASPSSVYHHFPGLPALTAALLVRTFSRLFVELEAAVAGAKDARGCVESLVAAHLRWAFTQREEARFMYQATSLEFGAEVGARLVADKAAAMAPLMGHIARFVGPGGLPAWSPLQLELVLLGPAHEGARRALAGAPVDEAWLQRELPRLAWKGVADEQAAAGGAAAKRGVSAAVRPARRGRRP